MPLVVHCPDCQKKLKVPSKFVGTLVSCPACQRQFNATATQLGGATEERTATSEVVERQAGIEPIVSTSETLPTFSTATRPTFAHERVAAEQKRRSQLIAPADLGPIQFGLNKNPINQGWVEAAGGWPGIIVFLVMGIPLSGLLLAGAEVSFLNRIGWLESNAIILSLFPLNCVLVLMISIGVAFWVRNGVQRSYFNVRQNGIEFNHRGTFWQANKPRLIPYSNIKGIVAGDESGFMGVFLKFARVIRPWTAATVEHDWAKTVTLQLRRGRNIQLHKFTMIYTADTLLMFRQYVRNQQREWDITCSF